MTPDLSIMFLTYNRPKMALKCLTNNLLTCGTAYELLICDQGTENEAFLNDLKQFNPAYLRLNAFNEGISRSLNQLIIRSRARHLFFMPDDTWLPDGWGEAVVRFADKIKDTGIVGFEGQDLVLPKHEIDGLTVCMNPSPQDILKDLVQVYGPILMTRALINTIGGFCEEYHPYGFEDADICFRCILAGLWCYYIPGYKSDHRGVDINNKAKKDLGASANVGLHRWRAKHYPKIGIYEPMPIMREPLV